MVFPVKGAVRGRESRESGEGWGLVGKLEEGGEYEFYVVAVVMVEGSSMQGVGSEPVRITIHGEGEGEREHELRSKCTCLIYMYNMCFTLY